MFDRVDELEGTVRALADPHRRALLDALRDRDGRSVSDLETVLPALGRHAVLKHLGVLESAGLVTSRKDGRVRTVHLNPVPIVALAQRWLDDYSAFAGLALTRLRIHLQRKDPPMDTHTDTTRTLVASIVIEADPDRVWQAITDPDETSRWFFGSRVESDWAVGAPIRWVTADGEPLIVGVITEFEEGRRIVHTFRAVWSPETAADAESTHEWLVEPAGEGLTRVTTRQWGVPAGTATAEQIEGGEVLVVSALKTFVETGRTLSGMG